YELASWSVMIRAGLAVLAGDLAVHAATLLRAERRAGAFAAAELGGGALRIGATLAGLAIGLRSAELLFDATTLGYTVGAAIAVPALWRRLKGPVRIDRIGLRELIRHGPGALPFSVAAWIERLADRLILESFLGTAVVGIYSVGYTVGERTMGTLAKAVFMMAWPNVLAAWSQGGTPAARVAVREAQVLYLWFTTGPVVFLIAYGAALMRWFTGAGYHDSADLVPIIAASMWVGGYATYLNRHLELGKRFATLSAITMAGALVNVALNLWLVPRYGMAGAAWSTMINRLLNFLVFFAIRDRALVSIPFAAFVQAVAWSLVLWLATTSLPVGDTWRMAVFVVGYAPIALLAMRRSHT
ncbi:MAG TPA: polysaccharide biosynthesis C-terminal domain-containing protein, partial [Ilumatobacteraceae bacterium]|nr:polysaccharide biosynthesis C-terminal domain-containing protein [Ilumatobacteraceae bacterium]